MTVRIATDSTSDLPANVIEQLNICVLPIYIHIGDRDYLDGVDINREVFYRNLPNYPHYPQTAVPSPSKFQAIYDSLADEGATEILSIHISATLSGITDIARSAARDTRSANVTVLDSRQLSLGTGFLVQTAAELANQGLSIPEMLPVLQDQIKRTYVAAGLDTLKYMRRSGRMNVAISTIGELVQIKPILTMLDGTSKVERVRTYGKMVSRLSEMIRQHAPYDNFAFLYSGNAERMAELIAGSKGVIQHPHPYQEMINPALGAHIGPGVIGFAGVSKKGN